MKEDGEVSPSTSIALTTHTSGIDASQLLSPPLHVYNVCMCIFMAGPACDIAIGCGALGHVCMNGGRCNDIKGTCECPDKYEGKKWGYTYGVFC